MNNIIEFFKGVFNNFSSSNTFEKGAALAYYTVFSFFPMILIIISLIGLFFDQEIVSGEIFRQLSGFLGEDGAAQIQEILAARERKDSNLFMTILGFIILAFTATGTMNQIQSSFNAIWGFKTRPESSYLRFIVSRFVSFGTLLTIGAILFASTFISGIVQTFTERLPDAYQNLHIYEYIISLFILSLVFGIMYKYLGDAKVHWKVALVSGAFTSVLFLIGKLGIGYYLSTSDLSSSFGTASIIALLMIWVYYSSQIIFLGAAFACQYSVKIGKEIQPDQFAISISEAQQKQDKENNKVKNEIFDKYLDSLKINENKKSS